MNNNNKIMYQGIEYKDKFSAITKFKPSFLMRLQFLFSAQVSFEHESFTAEIMPAQKTIGRLHIFSAWDWIKLQFSDKRGGMMLKEQEVVNEPR